ncbi:ABC transporter permease [Jiangella ureilytica]|nr:ABC transporter permease [Jiangella ureilytica]
MSSPDTAQPRAADAAGPAPPLGPGPAASGGRLVWRPRGTDAVQTTASLAALVLMILVFSVLDAQFRSWDNVVAVVDAAAVLAVVTVGLTFVLLLGAIDLSVEGVIGACALTVALLVANSRTGLDLGVLGVAATVALGAAFGLLSGVLSTRLRIPSFLTTLGVYAIGLGVATILFSGERPIVEDPWLGDWASSRFLGFTIVSWVAAGAILVGWLIQRYTRVGRYAYAIGGAEDIARLSGVPVARYKTAAFAVAGAFYGLGAVMATSQLGSGVVQAGSGLNFSAIAAAVIGGTLLVGGRGGVLQSMIGVLVLTVLQNGLILAGVSPYAQQAVQGVIVVVAVAAATWPVRHRLGVVK